MRVEDRLKQLIIDRYSSLKAFSDSVGISNSTVDSIIKRGVKNANITNVISICRALNIDVDELSNGNIVSKDISHPMEPREQSHMAYYRRLNDEGQGKVDIYTTDLVDSGKYGRETPCMPPAEYTDIPVYDEPAAAGIGNYLRGSSYETVSVPAESVPQGAEFGIRISGDSMEPEIHDGDIVWVRPQISLENGETGIFILGSEAFCKKLHIDHERQEVRLVSLNSKYDDICVKDTDSLRTIGRVLGRSGAQPSVSGLKLISPGRTVRGIAAAFGGASLRTEMTEKESAAVTRLMKEAEAEQKDK